MRNTTLLLLAALLSGTATVCSPAAAQDKTDGVTGASRVKAAKKAKAADTLKMKAAKAVDNKKEAVAKTKKKAGSRTKYRRKTGKGQKKA